MLAGAHWVLRIVTGRQRASEQARTLGELPGMRRRRAWAQSVHQTLDAVGHCYSPWWQLPPPTGTSRRSCAARSSGLVGLRCWQSRRHSVTSGSPSRPRPCGN
jgi:hypothetical protein